MNWIKSASLIVIMFAAVSCATTGKGPGGEKGKEAVIKEYWDDKSIKGAGPAKGGVKAGKWTLYHKTTGEKQGEGEFLNNQQNGKWVFFYRNGQISTEGEFIEGQKTGEWKAYHESGELLWKAGYVVKEKMESGISMKIGGMEGLKTSFFKNGRVWKEEEFHDGLKNGRSQEYFEEGKPKEIAWYKDNEKNGAMNEWYENGNKKSEGFNVKNERNGKWKFFHNNGQLAVAADFKTNKPDGQWRFFSREGQLMREGAYKEGKETGLWTFYSYAGGRQMRAMELTLMGGMVSGGLNRLYENSVLIGEGVMNGIPKGIFESLKDKKPTGTIETADVPADDEKTGVSYRWTGRWKIPRKNGAWIAFFPDGRKKKSEATYMMDKLNGKYQEYHQNGKLKAEGEYLNGKKNGEWKFYNTDGSLDAEASGRYMLDKKSKF